MLRLPGHRGKRLALLALGGFFVAAGANHFLNPAFYVGIVPPYLPAHVQLVHVSGAFEILGGVAVLLPGVRATAGLALVVLLVAVFPANVHMAVHPELFPDISVVALYARLPVQLALVTWAYLATRPDASLAVSAPRPRSP